MNFLDIIICIPLVWGFYKGITKGLVIEAANIAALFLGIWGAVKFSSWAGNFMRTNFNSTNQYIDIIAFCTTFFIILISIYFLGRFLNNVVKNASLGVLNKLLGAAFGAGKFLLIISILFFVMNAIEKSYPFVPAEVKSNSLLYEPASKFAPLIIPGLATAAEKYSDLRK